MPAPTIEFGKDEKCLYDDVCDGAACRWNEDTQKFKCGKQEQVKS